MQSSSESVAPKQSMRTLWILLAVCVLPFAASIGLYHFAPPQSRMNYGELLNPLPLPPITGVGLDGEKNGLHSYKGKWILLHIDSGSCDRQCQSKLYKMRQVRATQNKNVDRIERVWLVSDDVEVDRVLLREYDGTVILRVDGAAMVHFVSTADRREHIWLIDPLGNLMLRYPPGADPSGMKNDLNRLLRLSRIG